MDRGRDEVWTRNETSCPSYSSWLSHAQLLPAIHDQVTHLIKVLSSLSAHLPCLSCVSLEHPDLEWIGLDCEGGVHVFVVG